MTTKYHFMRLANELLMTGKGQMKVFGSSMMPLIRSGSLLSFQRRDSYQKGDIVHCLVKGRYFVHKITKVRSRKNDQADTKYYYLISNNNGHDNGWTSKIFGKVVRAEYKGSTKTF